MVKNELTEYKQLYDRDSSRHSSGILIISRLEKGELAYVSESSKRQLKGKITRATISNVFWG